MSIWMINTYTQYIIPGILAALSAQIIQKYPAKMSEFQYSKPEKIWFHILGYQMNA